MQISSLSTRRSKGQMEECCAQACMMVLRQAIVGQSSLGLSQRRLSALLNKASMRGEPNCPLIANGGSKPTNCESDSEGASSSSNTRRRLFFDRSGSALLLLAGSSARFGGGLGAVVRTIPSWKHETRGGCRTKLSRIGSKRYNGSNTDPDVSSNALWYNQQRAV